MLHEDLPKATFGTPKFLLTRNGILCGSLHRVFSLLLPNSLVRQRLTTKILKKKIKSPRYNSFHKALFSLSIFSENKDAILSLGSHHYCDLLTNEAVEDLMASKAVKTIYLNSNMTPRF